MDEYSTMMPETILGIPGNTFFLIICVAVIAWFLTKRVEKFGGARPMLSDADYIQDIRNVAAFVGPYIGEIYLYLRAKYFTQGKVGPMFQPGGINDPTLADPLLPISRAQIKSWIDSNRLRMKTKYGEDFMSTIASKWDLSYVEKNGGIIEVSYVQNGKSTLYVV